ncbi:uncharacterized protein LOC110728147 [Chenopodium quinoa]|nr:uncharacterized protein LOC110728147 [Chenopodium quinoa]
MEEHHITKKRKIEEEIKKNRNSDFLTRKVKLYCPAVSKVVEIMAWEDQRLDFGNIARVFGLEPETLKLNGHFISRGVDLIASSVTWKSLLSFFSSKGLSTGNDSSGALVVDGKLFKSSYKRNVNEEGVGISRTCDEEIDSRCNKKLKESEMTKCGDTGLKRKNWVENFNPLIKRPRINGHEERECCINKLRCGYQLHETMKRMREDEVVASSCKRAR